MMDNKAEELMQINGKEMAWSENRVHESSAREFVGVWENWVPGRDVCVWE